MFFTSIILYYLEEYKTKKDIKTHQELKNKLNQDKYVVEIETDYILIFYTLFLALRIILVLVAVHEASKDQENSKKPNFWTVFLAFWFPIIYLIIHLITGSHNFL